MKALVKIADITLKDLLQSMRSAFALMFMFGVPIMVTVLFYFLFSGGDEEGGSKFNLPRTKVAIANLDQGDPAFGAGMPGVEPDQAGFDPSQYRSMGEVLIGVMQREELADLVEISLLAEAADARSLVDAQQAGVALIIPAEFTAAFFGKAETATIELYKDPTLTIGPGIVQSIVSQFLEQSSQATMGVKVAMQQLEGAGLALDQAQAGALAMQFIQLQAAESAPAVELKAPAGKSKAAESIAERMIVLLMGGMMVFYAFFTGAASAESILREHEGGTLSRLFTTPTPVKTILAGKFCSVGTIVVVQIIALIIFARLVFGISWGEPLPMLLFILGTVSLCASFGLFLVSLLKTTKQAGFMFGGVMTVTGMLGISHLFVMGAPNAETIRKMSLIVPQGWPVRLLQLATEGSPLAEILPYLGGALAISAIFFFIGKLRFQKRFA